MRNCWQENFSFSMSARSHVMVIFVHLLFFRFSTSKCKLCKNHTLPYELGRWCRPRRTRPGKSTLWGCPWWMTSWQCCRTVQTSSRAAPCQKYIQIKISSVFHNWNHFYILVVAVSLVYIQRKHPSERLKTMVHTDFVRGHKITLMRGWGYVIILTIRRE